VIDAAEQEFIIASLRKQRSLLSDLVSQLNLKDDLDKGARVLYDQITKQVEQNLKVLKNSRKDCLEYQYEQSTPFHILSIPHYLKAKPKAEDQKQNKEN